MELWDLYTCERRKTGRTLVRGQAVPPECFHLVVHVWLKNSRGQYLISQRAADRPTFPLMWECTGGSVLAGEDSLAGAVREVREEMGIDLPPEQGRLVFSRVRDWVDGKRFGDIVDVWEFPYEGQAQLDRAEGEVCAALWADREEIARMLADGRFVNTLGYILDIEAGGKP